MKTFVATTVGVLMMAGAASAQTTDKQEVLSILLGKAEEQAAPRCETEEELDSEACELPLGESRLLTATDPFAFSRAAARPASSAPRPVVNRTRRAVATPGACEARMAGQARAMNLCVTFALGSAELTPASRKYLDTVASMLSDAQVAGRRIAVEGFADASGDEVRNRTLSELRARAVADYLAAKGLARERLTTAGFGASRILSGLSPYHPANRRVEARLLD